MENQILHYSRRIVAKTHNSRIIKWFDLRLKDDCNKYGFKSGQEFHETSRQQNVSSFIDTELISNIHWELTPSEFVKQVGKLFSSIANQRSSISKNALGQEFTPMTTVEHIFDTLTRWKTPAPTTAIVDFASGTGNFIGWCLKHQLESFYPKQSTIENNQNSKDHLLSLLDVLSQHLYAIDIDPLSCFTTQVFTTLITLHYLSLMKVTWDETILEKCPPVTIIQENFFLFSEKIPTITPDIILGNPPYLFSRNLPKPMMNFLKSKKYKAAQGQFDLSDIFLEESMKILNPDGILGVIIPEAITVLENRQTIRKLLVEQASTLQINHVADTFKDVSVENILLFARKDSPTPNSTITITWEDFPSMEYEKYVLLQKTNIPLLQSDPMTELILEWIKKHFISINAWNASHPDALIRVFRGVELSKTGQIMQCPSCSQWMPLSQKREKCSHCESDLKRPLLTQTIIIPKDEKSNIEDSRPFLQQFSVHQPLTTPTAMIKLGFKGIQYKNLHLYSPNRILVRQLLAKRMLCATIVEDNSLTSQSIYNLILPDQLQEKLWELRTILTSDLISYFNYTTFSQGKRLFSRILLQKLKDLPWIPRENYYNILTKVPEKFLTEIAGVLHGKS